MDLSSSFSKIVQVLLLSYLATFMVACGGAKSPSDDFPSPADDGRLLEDVNKPRVSGSSTAVGVEGSVITLSVRGFGTTAIDRYLWEVVDGVNIFQNFSGSLSQSSITLTLISVDVSTVVNLRVFAIDVNGNTSDAYLITLTINTLPPISTVVFDDEVLALCYASVVAENGWTDIGQVTELDCDDDSYCNGDMVCAINSLDGIESLEFLEALIIPNNGVTDLSPLQSMGALSLLNLGDTLPDDLSFVDHVRAVRITPLIEMVATEYSVAERGTLEIVATITARAPGATINQGDVIWTLTSEQDLLGDVVGQSFVFIAPAIDFGSDRVEYDLNVVDSNGNVAETIDIDIDVNAYSLIDSLFITDVGLDACVENARLNFDWSDVGEVDVLDCLAFDIQVLDQMSLFPLLRDLRIDDGLDIEPIVNLNSLEKLTLNNNSIIDFDLLSGMVQLSEVTISQVTMAQDSARFAELSKMQNMPGLSYLALNDMFFTDANWLPDFRNFSSLITLDLSRNFLSEIDDLKLPSTLQGLDLSNNDLDDINVLIPFNNLAMLHLSGNKLLTYSLVEVIANFDVQLNTDIDFPFFMFKQSASEQIADVNLRDCVFSDGLKNGYFRVESFKKLTCAPLVDGEPKPIASVEGLGLYDALNSLTLNGHDLVTFNVNDEMENLKTLNLDRNVIVDLAELAQLPNLEILRLQDNCLTGNALVAMDGLESITYLHLDDFWTLGFSNSCEGSEERNRLASLEGIENFSNLYELSAAGNRIGDIPSLANLSELTVLNLSSNELDDSDLKDISEAANLSTLNLQDNIGMGITEEFESRLLEMGARSSPTNLQELNISSVNEGLLCDVVERLDDAIDRVIHERCLDE